VDYGNVGTVGPKQIQPLAPMFNTLTVPIQAEKLELAHIKYDYPDYVDESVSFLRESTIDQTLTVEIIRSNPTTGLLYANTSEIAINLQLLSEGLASLRPRTTAPETWREAQEMARTSRLKIWQYGDIDDEE
jgi:endonuclease YncB( thermonuclease family)